MAGGKFKIKGNDKITGYDSEIEVDIGADMENGYIVTGETIPEPTAYEKGTITWFVNFAVRKKSDNAPVDLPYTVTLNELPSGKRLFVKLPDRIKELNVSAPENKKVKVHLKAGDPPMGLYP